MILSRKRNSAKLERNRKSPMTFQPQSICLVNIRHDSLYSEALFLIDQIYTKSQRNLLASPYQIFLILATISQGLSVIRSFQ